MTDIYGWGFPTHSAEYYHEKFVKACLAFTIFTAAGLGAVFVCLGYSKDFPVVLMTVPYLFLFVAFCLLAPINKYVNLRASARELEKEKARKAELEQKFLAYFPVSKQPFGRVTKTLDTEADIAYANMQRFISIMLEGMASEIEGAVKNGEDVSGVKVSDFNPETFDGRFENQFRYLFTESPNVKEFREIVLLVREMGFMAFDHWQSYLPITRM